MQLFSRITLRGSSDRGSSLVSSGRVFSLIPAILLVVACGGAQTDEELSLASNGGSPGLANRTGTPVTGGSEGQTAADDDDDESGAKDYWQGINFDRANFEEVRQQVKKRYIDPSFDEFWAWGQAASFAVASNESRTLMLLPEAFYKARKDNPDEKGALKGKMFKLSPSDGYVLLEESKEKVEEKKKRLSDEEIRALREASKERMRSLHKAWDDLRFGQKDFDRVMDFVQREFKTSDKWTMKQAWIAAAQGFLFALDPHSSLVAKASWEDSNKKTQDSSFEGIGAILTQRPDSDYTIVESPIYGQPAVKAGVRAGDMIIEVDGKDIKGESLSKVVSRIRGPAGSEVVLTVQREGEPDNKKINIKRSTIAMKNVQGQLLDNYPGIAAIKVTGFVKTKINGVERTTDDDLAAEFERLSKLAPNGKLNGIILDLRNNSGGLLHEGIKMADRFLRGGKIVTVKSRNSSDDEVYTASSSNTWDIPVVVVVNDGTASAAEIVASALQDNKRALVVGDRTFGKASVQTLFFPLLQDDYYIKLTVARYYGPSGRTLQVTGVRPDIDVTPAPDGKVPLGFREENLSGHLVPLDAEYTKLNAAWADAAKACADKSGKAKKTYAADPNPAIKFDWQLNYAGDLLECTIMDRAAAVPR
jgi:C-terminal peptidase prc